MTNKYTKEYFKETGAKGGKQKGINNEARRKELLDIIEPNVDVMFFNLIRSRIQKNDELVRVIEFLKIRWTRT
jgi:hypothetical protein